MRVRPTNAILRFEGQAVSPREAAKTLAAEYILTGTLQPTGALLRVSVQLVRAADDTSLWGDHYDIDRKDLLTLQDRIAAEVAAALPIRMSTADRDRLARPQPRNTEAFELYLRGRAALVRYTAESTRYAIASFEKALQIDPRDATCARRPGVGVRPDANQVCAGAGAARLARSRAKRGCGRAGAGSESGRSARGQSRGRPQPRVRLGSGDQRERPRARAQPEPGDAAFLSGGGVLPFRIVRPRARRKSGWAWRTIR